MEESIVELLGQLPTSAMVGPTYNGYKGGWMCCSYYQSIMDYGLLDAVPGLRNHDFFPVGYGTTPEEAIKDSIRQYKRDVMNKYLIALPSCAGDKGFCHPTILVSAQSKEEAISKAMRLRPGHNIGDIKQVYY